MTPSEIALPGCAASARSIALSTTGVASKHIRSDEHARRTELQLERQREGLLDRGSGRFRRQPAHRHASDRDVDRDCCGGRIVGRSRTRCDHTGEQQAGNEGEQERETLHAGNIVKIRGSLVMIPSAPSRTRRSASRGSSTVQTYTAASCSWARSIAAFDAIE